MFFFLCYGIIINEGVCMKKCTIIYNPQSGKKYNKPFLNEFEGILKDNNYEIVDFEDKADIYIINTCSVTNESDKKSRKMINRARNNNNNAIIVVMGCYSQVNADEIEADIVIGNKDKSKKVEIIENYIKERKKNLVCMVAE